MNKLSWLLAGRATATAVSGPVRVSPGTKAWQSGYTEPPSAKK